MAAKCQFPLIWGNFFGSLTPKCSRILSRPQKAHPWPETRVLTHRSSQSVKKCELDEWRRKQKKEGKKEKKLKDLKVTYLSKPPTLCYPRQSCHVGWCPGRSQPCQVSSKLVQAFSSMKGRNLPFSYASVMAYFITTCDRKWRNCQNISITQRRIVRFC